MKKITNTFICTGLISLFISHDINAQDWEEMASLPETNNGRHHPVTWSIGGYGYLLTGSTASQVNGTKDFYRYDPSDDSWEQLDDFPGDPRSFAIGAVYDGKGYIGFGSSGNTLPELKNDLWRYDPETEDWEQLEDCPCAVRRHPAFTINEEYEKLYAGLGNNSANLGDWWEYDIATDTWEEVETFPGADRHHPFHFSIGEYSYAGLGHGAGIYNNMYRFDPADENDPWESIANAPGQRVAGTQFDWNGYGFVLSGDGPSHTWTNPSIFWYYDPVTDTWDELPPHPGISKWAPGSFVIDGVVYMVGGGQNGTSTYYDDMWAFDLEAYFNTVSVDGPEEALFSLYPNPASDFLYIESPEPFADVTAKIYSMGGRLLSENSVEDRIEVHSLTPGVYILELENGSGQSGFSRFVKK